MTPLRVVSTIMQHHCNIGAEGIVTCYLADTLDTPPKQMILAVFIADFEELDIRASIQAPATEEETEARMHELLTALQSYYIDHSVQERNQCARVQ